MDSLSTELTKFGLILDKAVALQFGISFIFGGPVVVALSHVALAIRELAIRSRKEYSSSDSDYKVLGLDCNDLFLYRMDRVRSRGYFDPEVVVAVDYLVPNH